MQVKGVLDNIIDVVVNVQYTHYYYVFIIWQVFHSDFSVVYV